MASVGGGAGNHLLKNPTSRSVGRLASAVTRRYTASMDFRSKLIATLKAIRPVLEEPGVLVVGSEVPNLLERGLAATLVVSQDIDIGVSVEAHSRVKARLGEVLDLERSSEEPSVWVPRLPNLVEVNFVGMDPRIHDASETYVLEDAELPLIVFGTLSFMRPGKPIDIEGLRVPVPRPAGLMLEKLLSDRSGEKGHRDLLVVLGLLLVAQESDVAELVAEYHGLSAELRHVVQSNLTILSLLGPTAGMPDPRPHRGRIARLLTLLDEVDGG